jgi:hypothetical protein
MRQRLAETFGEVLWSDLQAHAARDSVIIVEGDLDLLAVGEALAANDVPTVSAWINAGMLTKPSGADLARWPLEPHARFTSVIVAPFVLIRRPSAKAPS